MSDSLNAVGALHLDIVTAGAEAKLAALRAALLQLTQASAAPARNVHIAHLESQVVGLQNSLRAAQVNLGLMEEKLRGAAGAVGSAGRVMASYRATVDGVSVSYREASKVQSDALKGISLENAARQQQLRVGNDIVAMMRRHATEEKTLARERLKLAAAQEKGNQINLAGERAAQWKQVQNAERMALLNLEGERQQHYQRLKAMEKGNQLNLAGERAAQWKQVQNAERAAMLNIEGERQQHYMRLKAQERGTLLNLTGQRDIQWRKMQSDMAGVQAVALRNAAAFDTFGKQVFAASALVDKFGDSQARAFLGRKGYLVDEIANLGMYRAATDKATKATNLFTREQMRNHSAVRGMAGSLNQLWLTYGNLGPLIAGAAVGSAFKNIMTYGQEFEYQMTFVKALGGETAEAIERLSKAAKSLSTEGLYGPTEIASGLRILAQAGLDANQAMVAIPHTLNLATVGEMQMADAAVTLVGVMNAFSLSVHDISRIGDIFAKAAAVSQVSVEDMTQSMRMASVVGEQYGANIEDTATALTLLGKVNIKGTAAGTSLRNMLKELYTPLDRAAATMKKLGLETQNADGTMREFPDIIYDLRESLRPFTQGARTQILQEIFGERGGKEAIAMLSKTREEWEKLKSEISDSSGFMEDVASELTQTTKGLFTQAFNTLKVAAVDSFTGVEDSAKTLARSLKEMFGSDIFKKVVAGVGSVLAGVLKLTPVILTLGAVWVSVKVPMLAITGVMAAISSSIKWVTGAVGTLVKAAAGLRTFAMVAMGAATTLTGGTGLIAALGMLVTPVGIAVAGFAALAAAAWWYSNRTDSATQKANDMRDAVKAQNEKLREQIKIYEETAAAADGSAQANRESRRISLANQIEALDAELEAHMEQRRKDIEKSIRLKNLNASEDAIQRTIKIRLQTQGDIDPSYLEEYKKKRDLLSHDLMDADEQVRLSGVLQRHIQAAKDKEQAEFQKMMEEINRLIGEGTLPWVPGGSDILGSIMAAGDTKSVRAILQERLKQWQTGLDTEQKTIQLAFTKRQMTEGAYNVELDRLARERIDLATRAAQEEVDAINQALQMPKLDKKIKNDLENQIKLANEKLVTAASEAQAQVKDLILDRQIKDAQFINQRIEALTQLNEQQKLNLDSERESYEISRESDPFKLAGLQAQLAVSREYSKIIATLNKDTITHAARPDLVADIKAQLAEAEASMRSAGDRARQQSEELLRRSIDPMEGYRNVMRSLQSESMNFAKTMEEGLGGALKSVGDAFAELAAGGKVSFSDLVTSVMKDLVRLQTNKLFSALASNLMGAFFPTQTSTTASYSSGSLGSGIYSGGQFGIKLNHTGGIVGAMRGASRMVDPAIFSNAAKYHSGGLVTGEVPTILRVGEGVFTPEQMRALAPVNALQGVRQSSETPISVTIVNQTSTPVESSAKMTTDGNGMRQLEITIYEKVKGRMIRDTQQGGGLAPILENKYGLNPAAGARV